MRMREVCQCVVRCFAEWEMCERVRGGSSALQCASVCLSSLLSSLSSSLLSSLFSLLSFSLLFKAKFSPRGGEGGPGGGLRMRRGGNTKKVYWERERSVGERRWVARASSEQDRGGRELYSIVASTLGKWHHTLLLCDA